MHQEESKRSLGIPPPLQHSLAPVDSAADSPSPCRSRPPPNSDWLLSVTTEVNGRGLLSSQGRATFVPNWFTPAPAASPSVWWRRLEAERKRSGMLGLTRSFWDWRGRSFRALRGMLLRAIPLHSASDRGSGRLDGVRGPRELEVILFHSVRQWCYSTEVIDGSLLAEADNMHPQHLPQTQKLFPSEY